MKVRLSYARRCASLRSDVSPSVQPTDKYPVNPMSAVDRCKTAVPAQRRMC